MKCCTGLSGPSSRRHRRCRRCCRRRRCRRRCRRCRRRRSSRWRSRHSRIERRLITQPLFRKLSALVSVRLCQLGIGDVPCPPMLAMLVAPPIARSYSQPNRRTRRLVVEAQCRLWRDRNMHKDIINIIISCTMSTGHLSIHY